MTAMPFLHVCPASVGQTTERRKEVTYCVYKILCSNCKDGEEVWDKSVRTPGRNKPFTRNQHLFSLSEQNKSSSE